MEKKIFGLSEGELYEKLKTIKVPPGEDPEAFRIRVLNQLKKFEKLDVFEDVETALIFAANWARTTPQTDQEIRQGILDERERRLDSYKSGESKE